MEVSQLKNFRMTQYHSWTIIEWQIIKAKQFYDDTVSKLNNFKMTPSHILKIFSMTLYPKCDELSKDITGVTIWDKIAINRSTVSFRKIQNPVIDEIDLYPGKYCNFVSESLW